MPRFSANVSMMFTEHEFLDRFAAARRAGFDAVEFQFPYDFDRGRIAENLQRADLSVSVFNLSPGDWSSGDRGLAAMPGRESEFRSSVEAAISYAKAVDAKRLHVMAGASGRGAEPSRATFVRNLKIAADRLGEEGLEALIEPINQRDMPGYFLSSADTAASIIEEVGAPNLKLQFDIYHQQIIGGDVSQTLRRMLPIIGHIQIAGVPDRHEPDDGELNYRYLFRLLDSLGYQGWIGCEYRPRGATIDGLGWRSQL
jgi:2-dehydrotetronate isomerase